MRAKISTAAQLEKSHEVNKLMQDVLKASTREILDGPLQGKDNRIMGAEVAWLCFQGCILLLPWN